MRRTELFTTKDKIRKQSTQIMSRPPATDDDVYINSNPYIHLDVLAWKYLGDARLWWIIARANNMTSIVPLSARVIRIPIGSRITYYKE